MYRSKKYFPKFKVGDLVRPKHYCQNKGRLALVIREQLFDMVVIRYLDKLDSRTDARVNNLELVNESR